MTRALLAVGALLGLSGIAPFAWDRVRVRQPGTARATVSQALGSEYKGDLPFGSRGQVFVFARGDQVARIADYRGRATFNGFERPLDALPRDRATLRVDNLVVSPAG